MGGWMIAIAGVVMLGVLIEIIMPEGESKKYIGGVFALIVVLVIVSPLPKLLGSKSGVFSSWGQKEDQIGISQPWVQSVNERKLESDRQKATMFLEKKGFENANVVMICTNETIYRVERIRIDLNREASAAQQSEIRQWFERQFEGAEVRFGE